jgi:hypothetical protein
MKHIWSTILGLALVVIACPAITLAAPPAKESPRDMYYRTLGEYFKLPDSVVTAIRERKIPDEDLTVVLFMAKQTGLQPDAVADLRLLRKSWAELTSHFGLTPEIYFMPLDSQPAAPFTKAWTLYRTTPKTQWKKIVLDDNDIINLVNLRFVALYNKVPPVEVVRLRAQGRAYIDIAYEVSTPAFKAKLLGTDKKVRSHLREPIKKKPAIAEQP